MKPWRFPCTVLQKASMFRWRPPSASTNSGRNSSNQISTINSPAKNSGNLKSAGLKIQSRAVRKSWPVTLGLWKARYNLKLFIIKTNAPKSDSGASLWKIAMLFHLVKRIAAAAQNGGWHYTVPFQHTLVFNISRGNFLLLQADGLGIGLRTDYDGCRVTFGQLDFPLGISLSYARLSFGFNCIGIGSGLVFNGLTDGFWRLDIGLQLRYQK